MLVLIFYNNFVVIFVMSNFLVNLNLEVLGILVTIFLSFCLLPFIFSRLTININANAKVYYEGKIYVSINFISKLYTKF